MVGVAGVKEVAVSTTYFVFGSNLRGRHGAGAALDAAMFHGAIEGIGVGLAGNSYAIPTKNCQIKTLPAEVIGLYIGQFIAFTRLMRSFDAMFKVTRIGCGYAGLKDADMAPMFKTALPDMCHFDLKWKPWLGDRFHYWGTF